ncbi:class I SAM-dependent methyltransferase [Candidatus Woesearchaeota archaeon]|nr:class I SAM-dependent methyltransferase [Candidatus Woesearchaeota archaeon]
MDIYMAEHNAESFAEVLKDFLEKHDLTHLTEGGLIVDMGCGEGTFLAKLREYFPQARFLGIDSYGGVIESAAKEHPEITFQRGNIMDTKLPPSSVSIATSTAIIDYANGTMSRTLSLPDYANEMHRILIPGGTYYPFDLKFDEKCAKPFLESGFKQYEGLANYPVFQKQQNLEERMEPNER